MHLFAASLSEYKRLPTKEVNVGGLLIGNYNPIRVQTMTTVDTMNTIGTVEETIRCIDAGAELIRITAPSKKEAENLKNIKDELRKRGYNIPIVADIHFTPNAAEIAARLIEKVRINPGNYADKKKFEQIIYTDDAYADELTRIRDKFIPLLKICKEYGTAMRIGTNHGSLSDRIMSRYGDTAIGMVESAMEFLRIARDENYHNIVLSMKSSNPIVMVEAYRLLVQTMYTEFQEYYPLHLGVTEAGDGEDGRVKSAVGMGTLLEDGIGDTVRVSLTEAAEAEIPVCNDLVKRYPLATQPAPLTTPEEIETFTKRTTQVVANIGTGHLPVVITDFSHNESIDQKDLIAAGYTYSAELDKWNISDLAADYLFIADKSISFELPGTLRYIVNYATWKNDNHASSVPLFTKKEFAIAEKKHSTLNFIAITPLDPIDDILQLSLDPSIVFILKSDASNAMQAMRTFYLQLQENGIKTPIINHIESTWNNADEHLIHFATTLGGLYIENMGEGIFLQIADAQYQAFKIQFEQQKLSGRNYNETATIAHFLNTTAFSILQATRKRITKTEYISCPSCGRTLFDLQETTAMIRKRTDHLKGVKIAIMGCIVNGPGEMADADFGYVGSGIGKITLYKGQDVVKKNVASEVAVDELIQLLKESEVWTEPAL